MDYLKINLSMHVISDFNQKGLSDSWINVLEFNLWFKIQKWNLLGEHDEYVHLTKVYLGNIVFKYCINLNYNFEKQCLLIAFVFYLQSLWTTW